MVVKVNQTKAWQTLQQLSNPAMCHPNLAYRFSRDPQRAAKMSLTLPGAMHFDFSRQVLGDEELAALVNLAEQTQVKAKIEAMFTGEKINATEGRAVLHTALRNLPGIANPDANPVCVDGQNVMTEVSAVLKKIEKFSDEVLSGQRKGYTGKPIKNIVAIGIGGSYLGPEYLAEACKPYAEKGMNLVFVANVDGTDFSRKTAGLNPEETLVIIVSKTFTTRESAKFNAGTAKKWIIENLGSDPNVIKKHFVAVSTAREKVEAFGIDPENMFGFWDWVGGRYSATSAVGALPLALFLGNDNFAKILKGAYAMDSHFKTAPIRQNIPLMAALLDIWNINFMGYQTRAILPYSQAWWKYAPHCQQTEMESNGKRVLLDGTAVDFATGEIVFGEPGTNGQHSFYQLIHQGSLVVPCDFFGFIRGQNDLGEGFDGLTHQDELMTNLFAQPDALAFGQEDSNTHKYFPGNRPSNVFLLNNQGPFEAGLMLALLEHRVAAKGFVWGINSFDQFGVELGKKLGLGIGQRMALFHQKPADRAVFEGLNPSTASLLRMYLNGII